MKRLLWLLAAAAWILGSSCHDHPNAEEKTVPGSSRPVTDSDWALIPFTKIDSSNPILRPRTGSFFCPVRKRQTAWEAKDVFNPAIVVREGKIYMLYRAMDKLGKPDGTSRIGLAESGDAIHFTRHAAPVLYPENDAQKKYEWEGGCEDPRITEDEHGNYYMTYTAYDGKLARLMMATSKDLQSWTKHGPVFAKAYHGKYLNQWTKSGSIVSSYEKGNMIARKINGKYWMYWGDQNIWAATSDDLLDWTPVEMKPGEKPPVELRGQALRMPDLTIVIATRPKKFDSDLVESGPTAMLTAKGILLLYNSRNSAAIGDSSLPDSTYSAGQALLDKNDPVHLLRRMDSCFIKPDKPYEITGQVNRVCFVEGLARFHHAWFLYYGTADSKIAVAVKE